VTELIEAIMEQAVAVASPVRNFLGVNCDHSPGFVGSFLDKQGGLNYFVMAMSQSLRSCMLLGFLIP